MQIKVRSASLTSFSSISSYQPSMGLFKNETNIYQEKGVGVKMEVKIYSQQGVVNLEQ